MTAGELPGCHREFIQLFPSPVAFDDELFIAEPVVVSTNIRDNLNRFAFARLSPVLVFWVRTHGG